jgi:hypothetical protein
VKPGVRPRLRAECLKSLTHDSTAFTCRLTESAGALVPLPYHS